MTVHVVLADDDELVRSGIALLLDAAEGIEVVAEVGDGTAAVAAVRRLAPEVALLDVRMPGTDGVEATRLIAGDETTALVGRPVAALVLTTYHVSEAVHAALRAGASGFVLKDAAPIELITAVRAVADGEAWLDPAVTRDLLGELVRRPQSPLPAPTAVVELTAREREVLVLIAHGLSNEEIAAHLVVVTSTVKTHVNRIFVKLGTRDRAQAVALAYRSRLVGPDDPPPS